MTKAIRPTDNQNYYSSALQRAQIIEKAVSLAEQGKNVVDFKSYTDAFTTLVEKMNAKTAKGCIAPEHLQSYQELDRTLEGLGKRIEVVKSGKIQPPPALPIKISSWTSGWSSAQIAKYTVIGGLAACCAPQMWHVTKQTPAAVKLLFHTGQQVPGVVQTLIDLLQTFLRVADNAGSVVSSARTEFHKMTDIETLPVGKTSEENAAILLQLAIQGYATSTVLGIFKPFVPKEIFGSATDIANMALAGNAFIPNFGQKTMEQIELAKNAANKNPLITAAFVSVLPILSKSFSSPPIPWTTLISILGAAHYTNQHFNGLVSQKAVDLVRNTPVEPVLRRMEEDLEYLTNTSLSQAPKARLGRYGLNIFAWMAWGLKRGWSSPTKPDLKKAFDEANTALLYKNFLAQNGGNGAAIDLAQEKFDISRVALERCMTKQFPDFQMIAQPILKKVLSSLAVQYAIEDCATADSYCQDLVMKILHDKDPWVTRSALLSIPAGAALLAGGAGLGPALLVAASVPMAVNSCQTEGGFCNMVSRGLVAVSNAAKGTYNGPFLALATDNMVL